MTHINWHGDAVLKEVKQKAWQRVMAAGTFLKARIQQNVDTATVAAGPSRPGEFPHKVTGTLQKSIFLRKHEDRVAVDVGTKLVYGVHWETTNRPYIRRTHAEQLGTIKAILEGKATRTIEDIKTEAVAMRERHQEQKATIQEKKKSAKQVKQAKKAERQASKKARKSRQRSTRRNRKRK